MFINIILIIFVAASIFYDYRSTTNLKVDMDTKAVINLKRGYRLDIILFAILVIYASYRGFTNHSYTGFAIGLALVLVLIHIKIAYFNPKRLVITDSVLKTVYGRIPLDAIELFTVNEKAELVIKLKGNSQKNFAFKFKPRDQKDYDTILYCAEKLNVGNSKEIIQQHRLAQIAAQARGVFPMTGVIKDYAWGGTQYIPNLVGIEPQTAAELWLGTHPSGLGVIEIDGKHLNELSTKFKANDPNLNEIEINTTEKYYVLLNVILAYGQKIRKTDPKAVDSLPWLFKILDVARPLSIQIHPDKDTAVKGFASEESQKIALDDPKRTFKDDNDKPELAVALTDFYVLHGFDSKEHILSKIANKPALAKFKALVESKELDEVYKDIMLMDEDGLKELLADHVETCLELYSPLIEKQLDAVDVMEHIEIDGLDSDQACLDPDYWVAFCYRSLDMNMDALDPGLACFYLFNLLKLEKYQGVFQAANIPHAYLRGRNFEVMKQSDNVIRGGLTTKFINKELLIDFTDCKPMVPVVLEKDEYEMPVDFTANITNINGKEGMYFENAAIVYLLDGEVKLSFNNESNENHSFNAKRGEAYFITADQKIECDGQAELVITSCKNLTLPAEPSID